jgi:DNA-binding winged helix-turn-helix (wHTH) protein
VDLPLKTFNVLHYLVTHPNRLVTKDELRDAIWPETAVTDQAKALLEALA